MEPNSKLTLLRPDIWERAVLLSTRLTSYQYVPKVPGKDGTIYACGGGYIPTPEQRAYSERIRNERERKRQQDRDKAQDYIRDDQAAIISDKKKIEELEIEEETERRQGNTDKANDLIREIGDLRQKIRKSQNNIEKNQRWLGGRLLVPEGAMEWLLHEVGHWVAATTEERKLPSYGFGISRQGVCDCTKNFTDCRCGDIREWQAWAFEEIILAPFGPARDFCPPPHRGGVAFTKSEIPSECFGYVEQQIRDERIDVEEWRHVYEQWVQWGAALGAKAPWISGV